MKVEAALDADRDPVGRIKTRQAKRAARETARKRFGQAHRAEMRFRRQLRKVANQVGAIVKGLAPGGKVGSMSTLSQALRRYSEMLGPWAAAVSKSMVEEVARRDEAAWAGAGREIGRELRAEIAGAPTGAVMRQKMAEAESLITSLPLEAAQRVHQLVIEAMPGGVRAAETAKEIERTGEVTLSRANLIARTETTRAATALVEARARHVGSEGYIWRTVGDADVRERHKHLEGTFVRWDAPPVAGDRGERAHAGAIYNCRCWPEPVIPDVV